MADLSAIMKRMVEYKNQPPQGLDTQKEAPEWNVVSDQTSVLGKRIDDLVGTHPKKPEENTGSEEVRYDERYFEEEVIPNKSMEGKMPGKADLHVHSPRLHDPELRDSMERFRPNRYYSYADSAEQWKREQAGLSDMTPEHTEEAKKLICDWYRSRHNTNISPDDVLLCRTTTWGMQACAEQIKQRKPKGFSAKMKRLLTGKEVPSSSVAGVVPVYNPFYDIAQHVDGMPMTEIPLFLQDPGNPSLGWKFDARTCERIIAKTKPATLLLSNPNNPTGYAFSGKELQDIIAICKKYDVTLISDEVWCDQSDEQHIPASRVAQECGYADKTITAFATGKTFNTSGFPCNAIIVQNPELRKAVQPSFDALQPKDVSTSLMKECMTQADTYLPPLRNMIRENMRILSETLEQCGMKTHIPGATFVLFVHLGKDPEKAKELLEAAGIMTSDGEMYGTPGKGFVRIVASTPTHVVRACCERLKQLTEAGNS